MTDEMRIRMAEGYLLEYLREVGQPLSTEDLDSWRRSRELPVTPSDVQGATWNLIERGEAAFTSDRRIVSVGA